MCTDYVMYMVPPRPEESTGYPGTRVIGSCEPLCRLGISTCVLCKSKQYS